VLAAVPVDALKQRVMRQQNSRRTGDVRCGHGGSVPRRVTPARYRGNDRHARRVNRSLRRKTGEPRHEQAIGANRLADRHLRVVAVGRKLPELADGGYREHAWCAGGEGSLPCRAPGCSDTCHSLLARLGEFEREELRGVIATNSDADHIQLPLDARIECGYEIAASATQDDLQDMQLGTRRKTEDALRPRAVPGGDDTSAVGAMPDRIDRPTAGSRGIGKFETLGHMA
jgi:hypothetical protein